MKLISLYTFIFVFSITNQIRLLEGRSQRSQQRSRSSSPKKNGGNLQNVFGAINMQQPKRNSVKSNEKQQQQNLLGLKSQLSQNSSNGKSLTKYIKKSNKLDTLDVMELNSIQSDNKKSIKKQDKEGQEIQKMLNKVNIDKLKNEQNVPEKQKQISKDMERKVNIFFKDRNFKLKTSSESNDKKRNILDNKNMEIKDEFSQQPVHKRVFEVINKEKNKQDIEKNTDPIQIVYEMGRVQQELRNEQKYKIVEELLEKADSILKKYIRIQKSEEKKIIFPKKGYKKFKTNYQNDLVYTGHLVVLIKLIKQESSVLAQSNVLQQTEDHRAIVGFLEINAEKLNNEYLQSSFESQRFILTLVHEIIHILAFNTKKDNPLETGVSKPLQNLSEIAEAQNPSIYDDSHWNEAYIPNDIMTPISRKNQILTIYTLEMIEDYSSKYQTLPKYLPNNFLFDTIENKKQFFQYQCTNDEAKYPSFCTQKDLQIENWGGCTGDYLFKTYCKEAQLGNNCNLNIPTSDGNCMDVAQQNAGGFEEYGVDSRCMRTDQNFSICARFRLEEQIINNKSEIRIFFTTKGKEKECTEDGEVHSIGKTRIKGKKTDINVVCPNLSKFITYFKKTSCKDQCNQNGFCSDGKCICFDGFDSKDNCKSRIIKNQDKTVFTKFLIESK